MMNDLKLNFKSAIVFLPYILLASIILLIISYFLLPLSLTQSLILSVLLLLTDVSILVLLGRKRRLELDGIKKIISQIRTNSYRSADEINMGKMLNELET